MLKFGQMGLLGVLFGMFTAMVFGLSLTFLREIAGARVNSSRKGLAYIVVLVHLLITYFNHILVVWILYDILIRSEWRYTKLLVLNVIYLSMIAGLAFCGMCPLTIWYNKLLNNNVCTPFLWKPAERISHHRVALITSRYTSDNPNCIKNLLSWLSNQQYILVSLLVLNSAFLLKNLRSE